MLVHYLWIGSDKVPYSYFNNINQCIKINPGFDFNVWDDQKCLDLLKEYEMVDYWNSLPTFISKCCMIRYLILDKFGGIYTDFDISLYNLCRFLCTQKYHHYLFLALQQYYFLFFVFLDMPICNFY